MRAFVPKIDSIIPSTLTDAAGTYAMQVQAHSGELYAIAQRLNPCGCSFRVFHATEGSGDTRTLLIVAPGSVLEGIDFQYECAPWPEDDVADQDGKLYLPALRR